MILLRYHKQQKTTLSADNTFSKGTHSDGNCPVAEFGGNCDVFFFFTGTYSNSNWTPNQVEGTNIVRMQPAYP